jgi:hypothetical protein
MKHFSRMSCEEFDQYVKNSMTILQLRNNLLFEKYKLKKFKGFIKEENNEEQPANFSLGELTEHLRKEAPQLVLEIATLQKELTKVQRDVALKEHELYTLMKEKTDSIKSLCTNTNSCS